MLAMIGYIFMFKMVNKIQNSGLEIVAGLTRPLNSNSKHVWIMSPSYMTNSLLIKTDFLMYSLYTLL